MAGKFLSLKQVSEILNCSEKEVKDLMREGSLPYYRIANQFIRFKEDEVLDLKRKLRLEKDKLGKNEDEDYEYTFTEKLVDFLYFNDFYILAALIIFLILAIIFLEVF